MKPIKVSDVREFVFCPRAWIYRQRGVRPLLHAEERLVVEQRLEDGRQFHQDHGEAVFQAVRERRRARDYWQFAIVAIVIAFALFVWGTK